jgi:hypothetical protein
MTEPYLSALALRRPKNLINLFEYKRLGALFVDPGKIPRPVVNLRTEPYVLEESDGLEPRYLGKSKMACKLHSQNWICGMTQEGLNLAETTNPFPWLKRDSDPVRADSPDLRFSSARSDTKEQG